MSIQVNDGFKVNTNIPVDSRYVVADLTARDAVDPLVRYDGLATYVRSTQTTYRLKGGILNANWVEDGGAGGTAVVAPTTGKVILVNNSVNSISELGEYVADCPGMFIEYYITRRVDGAFKTMTGILILETVPDAAISANRWQLNELKRSENGGASGITFSLSEVATEKSILVITLDNFAGANHICKFYYKVTKLSHISGKLVILANNSINPINSIGDYILNAGAIIVDYLIYRKTDLSFKTMSGRLVLEANPDAVTNPAKWEIYEMDRSEKDTPSGVTFSLDDVDVEKSILVVTLDNMPGSNHRCDFYYNKTVLMN
jgi:hypothetical protein